MLNTRPEMAIDQVQRRTRRGGPHSKTGCATCKVRKIKCDEAKPRCKRCVTTGRNCDGYSSDITIFKDSVALIQRISVHISGTTEEKRSFEFFLRNTAAELSGYYDSSFWERLVLAACAQKPSLRHAVIALGALHEDFSRKGMVPSIPPAEDPNHPFAMKQYGKAMGALRRSLANGKEDPLTALMSCILFFCFDSLRGWFESAMAHLQSGLGILRDMRRSSTGNHIVEDSIAPLFKRLSIQSIVYVETKSKNDKMAFARKLIDASEQEIIILEEFEGLKEARNALDQAADGLFSAFYMWDADIPFVSQPPESLALFNKYASQLSLWNLAFTKFMASKSKILASRELQAAALLKIHHTTVKIMAGIQPEMSDIRPLSEVLSAQRFLGYVDDFQIIINLSRPLIATAEQDANNGKPPVTFSSDLGLIGPLYYVCVNCPVASTRTAAMELLLRSSRHEGMWNSVMVAQMIQTFWGLEARHKEAQEMGVGEVDEFGLPVPFTDNGSLPALEIATPEWVKTPLFLARTARHHVKT
ncbi:putative UPC2 Regulatory involved in control of sterol uptake protein [Rutstroemia sp. NJR-2017a WRK4]|nr:putative UPC2 Regulatory involved in control of sterol uptake protein [Rutstroemia sp. NJR-2017a WRK4]